jgi:hypothetical protein
MTDSSKQEELRERILTIGGACIGPYDTPHRCSSLHCGYCGLCDVSEDIIALIDSAEREAVLKYLPKPMQANLTYPHDDVVFGHNKALAAIYSNLGLEKS